MKKYELTEETILYCGVKLHRIKAIKSIGKYTKEGDLGGFVQDYENLSQKDECWVCDDSIVFEGARVSVNARVSGNSVIYGNAQISGDSYCISSGMTEFSKLYEKAYLKSSIMVGNSRMFGEASAFKIKLSDNSSVSGNATLHGSYSDLSGDAIVSVTPITLQLPNYDVVVCDNVVIAGRQSLTPEDWDLWYKSNIRNPEYLEELEAYKRWKPIILRMFKEHQKSVKG